MDIEFSQEQVTKIASSILVGEVHKYINEHQDNYILWLKEELKNNNLTQEEFDFEIKQLEERRLKNDIIPRVCEN